MKYGVKFPEFSASGCAVVVDHTTIVCTTGPGAGANLVWSVNIAGLVSVAPVMAYAAPVITGFAGDGAVGASTDGGQRISLIGRFFGPPPSSEFLERVTYGNNGVQLYDATAGCTVLSHELLTCAMLPGVGGHLLWFVTIRGQTNVNGAGAVYSSYAPPSISSITFSAPLTPAGGVTIVLDGANYGLLDPSVVMTVTFAGAPIAQTLITHAMKNVSLGQHSTTMAPADAIAMIALAASQGIVSNASAVNAAAGLGTGADGSMVKFTLVVNTTASNGVQNQTAIDTNGAEIRLLVTSYRLMSEVTFTLPPGEGCCKSLFITSVGAASATNSPVFELNYEVPLLRSMQASTEQCSWTSRNYANQTQMGSSLCVNFVLSGDYFGTQNAVQVSTNDPTGATANVSSAGMTPAKALASKVNMAPVMDCTWQSVTTISCFFVYFGLYSAAPFGYISVVDLSGRVSATKQFSNFAPQFPAARIAALVTQTYSTDGTSILGDEDVNALEGANIGNRTNVYIDGKRCVNIPPWNPSDPFLHVLPLSVYSVNDPTLVGKTAGRVKCRVPRGYGSSGAITVYNDNMPNEIVPNQLYTSPTISCMLTGSIATACPQAPVAISPSTDGSTTVTLIGNNFGNWPAVAAQCSNNFTVPLAQCANSLECHLVDPVTCAARPRTASAVAFPPGVAHVVPPLGFITVVGEIGVEALVRVWTDNRIVFDVPVGTGAKRALSVGVGITMQNMVMATPSVGGVPPASYTGVFGYAPPQVSLVTIQNAKSPYGGTHIGSTQGGQQVFIVGKNFGVYEGGVYATVTFCRAGSLSNCKPCTISNPQQDVQHTSIMCYSPAWVGANLFVRVLVRDQDNTVTNAESLNVVDTPSSAPALWSYHIPTITGMNVTNATTGARCPVTLTGSDFGASDPTVPLTVTVRGYDSAEFNPTATTHVDRVATVLSRTHTRVVFVLPQGNGAVNDIFVTTGGQNSICTKATQFAYNPPTVTQIDEFVAYPRKSRTECCNTDGGYKITIRGDSFGVGTGQRVFFQQYTAPTATPAPPPPPLSLPQWSVGYPDANGYPSALPGAPAGWLECTDTVVTSHKVITCTMPAGIGANLTMGVFIGGPRRTADYMSTADRVSGAPPRAVAPQANRRPYIFSYDLPYINRMQPDPGECRGLCAAPRA